VDKDNRPTADAVEKAADAVAAGQDPTGGQAPVGGGGGGGGGGTTGPQPVAASIDTTVNTFDSGDLSGWLKDRYDPYGFEVVDGVLVHTISAEDGQTNAFANTQGKKLNLKD